MLGAGKTTILKILGGKHMVDPSMVRVLGRSAFHDTALTSSGDLCYLGGEVGIQFKNFISRPLCNCFPFSSLCCAIVRLDIGQSVREFCH